MSVLIWNQTVCKGYQQTTKVDAIALSKERVHSIFKNNFVIVKTGNNNGAVQMHSLISIIVVHMV